MNYLQLIVRYESILSTRHLFFHTKNIGQPFLYRHSIQQQICYNDTLIGRKSSHKRWQLIKNLRKNIVFNILKNIWMGYLFDYLTI